jgi:ligand-binding sensor domain-containing protein
MTFLERALLAALVWAGSNANAQTHRVTNVGADLGLAHDRVNALFQDTQGFLWIATDHAVVRYDGEHTTRWTAEEGLACGAITCMAEATDGSLWLGHRAGGLSRLGSGTSGAVYPSDLMTEDVVALATAENGGVWVATLGNGLLHASANGTIVLAVPATECGLVLGLATMPGGTLLAATHKGPLLYSCQGQRLLPLALRTPQTHSPLLQALCTAPNGALYATGERPGSIWTVTDPSTHAALAAIPLPEECAGTMARSISAGRGMVLLGTGSGAYLVHSPGGKKARAVRLRDEAGVLDGRMLAVLLDRENGAWLAPAKGGLFHLNDDGLTAYGTGEHPWDVMSMHRAGNQLHVGLDGSVVTVDTRTGELTNSLTQVDGTPWDAITAVCRMADGSLALGTWSHGVWREHPSGTADRISLGPNNEHSSIIGLALHQEELWIATDNAVFVYNGTTLRHLSSADGLAGDRPTCLAAIGPDDLWIGFDNGMATRVWRGALRSMTVTRSKLAVRAVVAGGVNTWWFATDGDGVYRYGPEGATRIGQTEGLVSDQCTALALDGNGQLFVGHPNGLSYLASNGKNPARALGLAEGNTPVVNHLLAHGDTLWLGTSRGLLCWIKPGRQRSLTPLPVRITGVSVFDRPVAMEQPIVLPPNVYSLRFSFCSNTLGARDQLVYTYKLDGYDPQWTTTSNGFAEYRRLEHGERVFHVKACNQNGQCTPETLVTVHIQSPIWQHPASLSIGALALVGGGWSMVRMGRRGQRKARSYLRRLLDVRTRELDQVRDQVLTAKASMQEAMAIALAAQQSLSANESSLGAAVQGAFVMHMYGPQGEHGLLWCTEHPEHWAMVWAAEIHLGLPATIRTLQHLQYLQRSAERIHYLGVEAPSALHALCGTEQGPALAMLHWYKPMGMVTTNAPAGNLLHWRNGALLPQPEPAGTPTPLIHIPVLPGDRLYALGRSAPVRETSSTSANDSQTMGKILLSMAHLPLAEQAALVRNKLKSQHNDLTTILPTLVVSLQA